MKRKMALLVVAGCIGAGAAVNNYDLLGRRGSQMNTPMVYRDIDYSKFKKEDQNQKTVLAKKSLNNQGLASGIAAIEGAYEPSRRSSGGGDNQLIYFKRFYTANKKDSCINENGNGNNTSIHCWYRDLANNSNSLYLNRANSSFITTTCEKTSPNYDSAGWSNLGSNGYTLTLSNGSFSNPVQASPYEYNQNIQYTLFFDVKRYKSKRRNVAYWYDYIDNPSSGYYYEGLSSDVGVYLGIDALPVKMDPGKDVKYLRYNTNESYELFPGYEMMAAKTYSVVKDASNHSVIYAGKSSPSNPASRSPQIYIGVHNRKGVNGNSSATSKYSTTAKNLDNYIYQNRTVEVVASGNFATRNNANNPNGNGYFASEAHAANAITVGAIDASSNKITNYTSYVTPTHGVKKPEIFNYSHFYMYDKKRTYRKTSTGSTTVYEPYYDGAEMSAAYTAAMVSDLMAINPFYRWHPEVVKALLLSSSHVPINSPYPHNPQMRNAPSYYGLVFDGIQSDDDDFYHFSRYWIGNMDSLKTHTINNKKEIWFSYANPHPSSSHDFSAAIAWLSSGNDIDSLGYVPQDFDLWAYESNSASFNPSSFDLYNSAFALDASRDGRDSYERISFTTSSPYIVFRIVLYSEDSRTENPNQAVLGFDVATWD